MSSSKSAIKGVVRQHAPTALWLVPKKTSESASKAVPERGAARDTPAADCTSVVVDLAIYANMYDNVIKDPSTPSGRKYMAWPGKHFVEALLRNVRAAYDAGYDTVVLVLDAAAWTTEAKEYTQKKRSEAARAACDAIGVRPLAWDHDAPTRVVEWDRPMAPLCAIKATRTAFRYACYQAMQLALRHYAPPAGCRLIVDMQPYDATNPERADDWLRHEQIRVPDAHRAEVDALRRELVAREHLRGWRHAARQLATELARAGKVHKLPYCLETSAENVPIRPFVLANCANTGGEADLTAWRYVPLLYPCNKRHALAGVRELPTIDADGANAQFYSDAQLAAARRAARDFRHERVRVGAGAQRTLVVTRDSDFISFGLLAYARLLCDYAATLPAAQRTLDALDAVGRSAPLVNLGDTHATRTGLAQNGSVFGTASQAKSGARPLQRVHELLDVHRFFCLLVLGAHPPPDLPDPPAPPPPPPAAGQKRKRAAKVVRHVPSEFPALTLPPLSAADDAPRAWLERALTFALYCAVCGNDYLLGLCGVTHATMYRALRAMLRDAPRGALAHVRHTDGPPSAAPLCVDAQRYVRFVSYCYQTHLDNYSGPNRVSKPPRAATYAEVAAVVERKYAKSGKYHMPDEQTLALMLRRTIWSLHYAFYGPDDVARTIDASRYGWPPGKRREAV